MSLPYHYTIQEASVLTSIETSTGETLSEEQLSVLLENPLFALEVKEALEEDGEVDIENGILKDSSFINTPMDCVLTSLIEDNNNLWKRTSEAFRPNDSPFNIRFSTYNNPIDTSSARTGIPDENGLITIRFHLANISSGGIDIATDIFHETFHAELHRIHFSNNSPPNSLSQQQFQWFEKMWRFYSDQNSDQNYVATASEHYFMAQYLINPISRGLREFDSNSQTLEHYKYPSWSGLESVGIRSGYISRTEINNLSNLYSIVVNDSNTPPCN
ncbi:hypothetical protein [Dokdonia sp. Hel_I_53]|uniref:hypothetical protein n=1 Tax=Dokdonia sp. Hel_I_53 TaxID=1566287 RepID=UPI00119BF4C0|nr:hypothetical protein [Dokdonia sp. Hel_I_53]TVZ52690.1 hypothetical protein OD90_1874 [Dokdonia sp. Hel_I_53]